MASLPGGAAGVARGPTPGVGIPGSLAAILGAALGLRLLLLPFSHPWDGQTFQNLFAELAADRNPYSTFWDLTLEARSRWHFGWAQWYEYYSYPPFLIYLYWPLAKVAAVFGPLSPAFPLPPGQLPATLQPLPFLLLYKAPIWIADAAIAAFLWNRTSSVGAVAAYALNPLVVIVSGAWMFDAIPVALVFAALVLLERGRVALSGVALALGALAKFFPLFLFPVFFMSLAWRRDPRLGRFTVAFVATCVLLAAPFASGFAKALAFNAARPGGGLTLHQVYLSSLKLQGAPVIGFEHVVSPAIGSITLVGGMFAAYAWLNATRPPLERALLLGLLAFLLSSKIVNEQYALWILPFLILEARRAGTIGSRLLAHAAWVLPLVVLAVRVPVTAFFPATDGLTRHFLEHPGPVQGIILGASALFTAVLVLAITTFRPGREAPA